ncbi:phosphatidate cytidylyltransferase [Mucilaginibacter yixingensis]|uniref:Phosphatidate cytidylyltransferase n=1 Tax=Mucilaginibacter yixingensis TaxID=1295612 RepID=A0A2T5J5J2_9SPHI|nr:phosphatidate cytidylyltransferase [Mucilaginibacter yixingensis]PTQ93177.1 phosphatidate cytidylyltransferase [Mucilaginibacter yixingensis]
MKTRAITGFFFVIVMLASVLINWYVFSAFFLLLSAASLAEFYGLIKTSGAKPNAIGGIALAITLYLLFALINVPVLGAGWHTVILSPGVVKGLVGVAIVLSALIFIKELFGKAVAPFANLAYTYFGLIFVIAPFICFYALGFTQMTYSFHLPLGFMVMLWANDTGAYLSGRFFGKHKLFERHSPKKTWEGFIGGVIISAGVGLLLSHYYTELFWGHWVVIALIISCFGTLGDLVESMFKRSIDVKDSGGILPGHGGLLDRFDGLLMAAPLVYAYLSLVV